MISRSVVALGALAAALAALVSDAGAQPYPPYGAQPYPPYRAPLPNPVDPDDDDDDLPPQHRAAPGNYPPPPGYRGPYAYEPPRAPNAYDPRPPAGVPEIERRAMPAPGQADPYRGREPTVVYGDRAPPADPRYTDPRYAPQQDPRYGAAPQPYDPAPGPMQIGPDPRDPNAPAYSRPPRDVTGTVRPNTVATLPPEEQPETGKAELPPELRRQVVSFQTAEPAGTLVIDTQNTHLYLVMGNGQAMRYGIGVGREGFTWAGAERVSKMSEWPDWHPPAEMIERQPYLPRFMAGGEGNPLGARALYLGKTLYRIHGTNQPSTIGKYVSSGCIRLTNEDIQDLYGRVQVGTRVVVLPGSPPPTTAQNDQPQQAPPVRQR